MATVGKTEITQATLNHWMQTTMGGDVREVLSMTAPEGIVSDPADYPRCVAVLKKIPTSSGAPSKLSDAQLQAKCRQLYASVKEEALSFLIASLWRIEDAAEHGSSVSEAELTKVLNRLRYEDYPNPASFRRSLAEQRRSLADERYMLKRNILNEKFLKRLKAQAGYGEGKVSATEKGFIKLVLASNAKWSAKTKCEPGYFSVQCKGQEHRATASPSTALVLEQVRAG